MCFQQQVTNEKYYVHSIITYGDLTKHSDRLVVCVKIKQQKVSEYFEINFPSESFHDRKTMRVIIISDFRPFIFPKNNSFSFTELTVTTFMMMINPDKNSNRRLLELISFNLFKEAALGSYGYYVFHKNEKIRKRSLSITTNSN